MDSTPATRPILSLLGSGALICGCSTEAPAPSSGNTPGSVMENSTAGTHFVVDANQGGQAERIRLIGMSWGRLVDVHDIDGALQLEDFVIGGDITSDQVHFRLDRDPITDAETLTILHGAKTAEYAFRLAELERSPQPVADNGAVVAPTATLTALPRNATLVLRFDDLLDAGSINSANVAVLAGHPPVLPHGARVIPDPSHGDLLDADGDGRAEFHTTRVLVDMAVSATEAEQSSPPLAVNPLGLPEALLADQPNVVVRIPTLVAPAVGHPSVLANLSGAGLSAPSNASNGAPSVTQDVVRSMRTASAHGQDPGDGFLAGGPPPKVLGVQSVNLLTVVPQGGISYRISASFDAPTCAPQPKVGDVIRVGSSAVGVVAQNGNPPVGGTVTDVVVRLEAGNGSTFVPGPAQYQISFDPTGGVPPPCFVRITPTPASPPDQGVAPGSTFTVRFSAPMDPTTFSAFETFGVTRVSNASPQIPLGNTIVGTVQPSPDLREFTFLPQLPLERIPAQFPAGEQYKLTLAGGANGVRDLSGQPLVDALPAFDFRLDPAAAEVHSRGFAFKFNSADEDGNGAPELRGQFLFDLANGTIQPRAVTRFSAVADASQPVVGLMTPFSPGIQTPLSNLGSKLMTVYRYHDLGLGLVDDSTLNLDVEGLAWAPHGSVQVDSFSQFRMALCHSKFLPDEILNPMSLLPLFPLSGLVKTFDQNQLDTVHDRLKVVHPKNRGYDVDPADAFVSSTGTLMMPYPMNRGVPAHEFTRYTFRDTGLLAVGGPNGSGVETQINGFATGTIPIKHYSVGKVPTLGLPLLMEFRCYADDTAFALNGFKVNLALNSSARPAFRAYSTGGVLASGALVKIDPDNQPIATGGFTKAGQPTGPGTETDDIFYLGQADFVVRVNRVHSIWMDSFQFTARPESPVIEPANSLQPDGTRVTVALRGVLNVTTGMAPPGGVVPSKNAAAYDPYGDPRATVVVPGNFVVTHPLDPNGQPDKSWKTDMAQIAPSRFFQARMTLISNPDTSAVPEITGMGFALTY